MAIIGNLALILTSEEYSVSSASAAVLSLIPVANFSLG